MYISLDRLSVARDPRRTLPPKKLGPRLLRSVGPYERHVGTDPPRAFMSSVARQGATGKPVRPPAIIDSQSVKKRRGKKKGGSCIDPHGYDAGKEDQGAKKRAHSCRHIRPLLLHAIVHPADIQGFADGGVPGHGDPCSGMFPFFERRSSPTADIKDRNWRKRLQKVLPHLDIEIVKRLRSGPNGFCGLAPDAGSSSAPLLGSIACRRLAKDWG